VSKKLVSSDDWNRIVRKVIDGLQVAAVDLGRTIGNNVEGDLKKKAREIKEKTKSKLDLLDLFLKS
jgi:hypothetical protein